VDPLEVAVDDIAAGGDGIAHAPDGRIVFVRGAIPGDRVRVAVAEDRPTLLRGTVERVVHPSEDRVRAPCGHVADGCGGCGWQHVSVDAQRRLKVRIAEESLRRIGRLEGTVDVGPTLPDVAFRTTVRCLVVDGRAAFRAERSNDPVLVEHCLVAHPALDELITHGRFGDAAEVTLRVGAATGERLVRLAPAVPGDVHLPADVRVVGADELTAGRRAWFTEEVGGRRFRVSADSFFQTRTDGAEALVAAVRDAGGDHWGGGHLVDLYGGVGLFGSCLGAEMSVTVVEAGRSSSADARHNLSDRESRVIRVQAGRWRPSPADVVVADPPRAGLGRDVVERIAATGASKVVLVSCDPASFGRDAGLLHAAGYVRTGTTLVDLFPHTSHLELVSSFDRAAR
jgi:23S rRNA (uracil1939-C5)-methyltransferase